MTTVDQVIERARSRVMHGSRGPVYTVGSAYTAGATSLVLSETPEHLAYGTIISVDYELMYILSVNVASKTLTVIPGYMGTTSANHDPNDVVVVDARFPKSTLLDLCEEELRSWGRRLPRVESVNLNTVTRELTYDLAGVTGEVYWLLDVRAEPATGASESLWVRDRWARPSAKLIRNMDPANFSTGYAIQLRETPRHAGVLRVTVAQPIDLTTVTPQTDLETIGVQSSWLDVLQYGIRMRALSGDVASRADWRAAGHSRDAEESNVMDLIRATSQAASMRDQRFADEANEFRSSYPYRSS